MEGSCGAQAMNAEQPITQTTGRCTAWNTRLCTSAAQDGPSLEGMLAVFTLSAIMEFVSMEETAWKDLLSSVAALLVSRDLAVSMMSMNVKPGMVVASPSAAIRLGVSTASAPMG